MRSSRTERWVFDYYPWTHSNSWSGLQNFLGVFTISFGRHFVCIEFSDCAKVFIFSNILWALRQANSDRKRSFPRTHHLPRQFGFRENSRSWKQISELHRWRVNICKSFWANKLFGFFPSLAAYQLVDLLYDQTYLPANISATAILKTLEKYFQHEWLRTDNALYWRSVLNQEIPFYRILTKWGLCLNFNMYPFHLLLNNDT